MWLDKNRYGLQLMTWLIMISHFLLILILLEQMVKTQGQVSLKPLYKSTENKDTIL